jgi:hypothetical protein
LERASAFAGTAPADLSFYTDWISRWESSAA